MEHTYCIRTNNLAEETELFQTVRSCGFRIDGDGRSTTWSMGIHPHAYQYKYFRPPNYQVSGNNVHRGSEMVIPYNVFVATLQKYCLNKEEFLEVLQSCVDYLTIGVQQPTRCEVCDSKLPYHSVLCVYHAISP